MVFAERLIPFTHKRAAEQWGEAAKVDEARENEDYANHKGDVAAGAREAIKCPKQYGDSSRRAYDPSRGAKEESNRRTLLIHVRSFQS